MPPESAHNFAVQLQQEFGINYSNLGAVMLNVETINILKLAPGIEKDLYFSEHPYRPWLAGDVASREAHVSLRYGLLRPAYESRESIDLLLADTTPKKVHLEAIEIFQTPFHDEEYSCIVARVRRTRDLVLAHDRLGYLPHVTTFPEYKPHVTLAYVDRTKVTRWAQILQEKLPDTVQATGLHYGVEQKSPVPA